MNRRFWRRRGDGTQALLGLVGMVLGFALGAILFYRLGFRPGQIGAMTSDDIRYKLVEQDDTWEGIEKP